MLILSLSLSPYTYCYHYYSIKGVVFHKPYNHQPLKMNKFDSIVMGGSDGNSVNAVAAMSSSSGSSRWNPTKEQISMLENLYKQGIKTPSAEEIQQITARLRPYGHIEGKNVFYWFQNHKARQRQKQKQETIAYFNRFLHTPPTHHPFFSTTPISPNPICGPYCIPLQAQSEIGYYPPHQHPKVLVPVGFRRSHFEKVVPTGSQMQQQRISDCSNLMSYSNQETLDLFPLHPTGILEEKQQQQTRCDTPSPDSDTIIQDHHHHHAASH